MGYGTDSCLAGLLQEASEKHEPVSSEPEEQKKLRDNAEEALADTKKMFEIAAQVSTLLQGACGNSNNSFVHSAMTCQVCQRLSNMSPTAVPTVCSVCANGGCSLTCPVHKHNMRCLLAMESHQDSSVLLVQWYACQDNSSKARKLRFIPVSVLYAASDQEGGCTGSGRSAQVRAEQGTSRAEE